MLKQPCRQLLVAVGAALVLDCDARTPQAQHHPIADSLGSALVSEEFVRTIAPEQSAEADSLLSALFRATRAVATIGELSGDSAYVLGAITRAAIDDDAEFLLQDESYVTIRRISAFGTPSGRVGRAGSGPGELYALRSLAVSDQGEMFVTDGRRRMHIFRRMTDEWEFVRTASLELDARDICLLGRQLFL